MLKPETGAGEDAAHPTNNMTQASNMARKEKDMIKQHLPALMEQILLTQ
ncbi:hypothetical protein JCM19233_1415 [Vibrio astriarenae]|nr:hypothetical protein JCM19233_1415 [Vibrio sp. C7]